MTMDFDFANKQVSSEWLTQSLIDTGFLRSGEVIDVSQKPSRIGKTITSEFFDLDIKYSPGTQGELPAHCLAKVSFPHLFEMARKEADFYEMMAGDRSGALLDCYGTSVSEDAASTIILLEDKGSDFYSTEWPIPPSIDVCERVVRSLAEVHARWWEHPFIDQRSLPRLTEESIDPLMHRVSLALDKFLSDMGDRVSKPRIEKLTSFVDWFPGRIKERIRHDPAQTLVHGDAHFWNFLIPHEKTESPILIDWQSWEIGFAPRDLVYTIGLHWFPERRQRYEQKLLDLYLDELHRHEIDYSHEQMMYDYRLLISLMIVIPVMQYSFEIPAGIWWPHFDRAFAAYDEHHCEEFA